MPGKLLIAHFPLRLPKTAERSCQVGSEAERFFWGSGTARREPQGSVLGAPMTRQHAGADSV